LYFDQVPKAVLVTGITILYSLHAIALYFYAFDSFGRGIMFLGCPIRRSFVQSDIVTTICH